MDTVRKLVTAIVVLLIVLYSASVNAQVRSLDLSVMSVEELSAFEDEIKGSSRKLRG